MKKNSKSKIAFYAEKDNGLYDEIILDVFENEYEYNSNIDKRALSYRNGNRLKEFLVNRKVVYAVYDIVDGIYSGSYYFEEKSYEERQSENRLWERDKANRPVIAKEKLWSAIRWELDERELKRICSYDFAYEKDDYYNLDIIIDKIHLFMSGEKPVRYFTAWCIVLMRCMYEGEPARADKNITTIYDEIADWFDSLAFMTSSDSEEERQKQCKEIIAKLKYYNHQIDDVKQYKTTDFEKNGVVVYASFAFFVLGGNDEMYSVCVADKRRRTVNYYFAPNLIMEEKYNITFVTQAEYGTLSSTYLEYKLDTSLNMDSQLEKIRS